MENKSKELDTLTNELAQKLLNEIIPECKRLFAIKGFTATIVYAVNEGIHFAINHIQKYI